MTAARSRLAAAGCALVGVLVGVLASVGGPSAGAAEGGPKLDRPLVVVAAPDAPRWVRLLRASGAAVRVGTVEELLARGAGVVTGAAQLSDAHRSQVRDWVRDGRRLVTPNDALLAEVGVRRGTEQ